MPRAEAEGVAVIGGLRLAAVCLLFLFLFLLFLLGAAHAAAVELRSAPLSGLRTEIAALIMQGVEGGGLPMAVVTAPEEAEPAGDEGAFRLPVAFELPGVALMGVTPETPVAGDRALSLELYLYVLDSDSAVVAYRAQRLEIDLTDAGEVLYATGLRFRDAVTLPEGTFELRFLAVAPGSRRYALVIRRVTLGDPVDPLVSAPRFAGGCESWLGAHSSSVRLGSPPLSARPVLRAGAAASGSAVLRGADRAGRVPAVVELEMRLRPIGDGGEIEDVELTVEGIVAESRGARIDFELQVPKVGTGRYEAILVASLGESRWSSPAREVWILGAGVGGEGDCQPPWGEIFRLAAAGGLGGERSESAEVGEPPLRAGAAEKELRRSYLGVLGELAAGTPYDEAAGRLAEIERTYLGTGGESFRELRAVEGEVVAELAAAEPRSLPVVLMLHRQVYGLHFDTGGFGMATHSRELVEGLVAELADGAEEEVVATVLVSLADQAERHRVAGASLRLLERALDLDPRSEVAQLLLAASHERMGRYALARPLLEALVSSGAQNLDARLRLAVLEGRQGRYGASERLARLLLGGRLVGWRRVVAYQTLARSLFSRERFEEAVEVLVEARARVPGDQRLALLLAYALDRVGRPGEAALLLVDLPPGELGGSPRMRYSEPPEEILAPMRDLLARSLDIRLPLLARAVREVAEP